MVDRLKGLLTIKQSSARSFWIESLITGGFERQTATGNGLLAPWAVVLPKCSGKIFSKQIGTRGSV